MTPNRGYLAGLVVVGAFVLGRYLGPEPTAPAASPAPAPVVHAVAAPSSTVVREREIVREIDREAPPAPAVEAPSPEQLQRSADALTKARSIVSSAVSAGRWTRTDAQALLGVLSDLDRDGASEVMTALIAPINAGHMNVETSGSLLDPT